MVANRPAYLLVDVRLEQLRSPVPMVRADEADDADVVQETGQDNFLGLLAFESMRRALQQMIRRSKAVPEKIDQRRLLRHLLQTRIVAHQQVPGLFLARPQALLRQRSRIALT